VKVTLLLCDFAEVADGKLFVLGAGWIFKGMGTPMALAAIVEVPWSETNQQHVWNARLVDADGHAMEIAAPDGQMVPIAAGGQFEVGRPPGHPDGTPQNVPLALNLGPLALAPGQRFSFIFEVDGVSDEQSQLSFNTQPIPPGFPSPPASTE
jgi:hypothetical protein